MLEKYIYFQKKCKKTLLAGRSVEAATPGIPRGPNAAGIII